MKRLNIALYTMLMLTILNCQSNSKYVKTIDNFTIVEEMPYICRNIDDKMTNGCGDSIFWAAIKQGPDIIPYLIDRLDDTTFSKASVPNFGGDYTIGDISLFALEILVWDIPVLEFAEDAENPETRNGSWGYWNYTRSNFENRIKFKKKVATWYDDKKDDLIWINSDQINICDCIQLKNPAGGHFETKNKN